MCMKIGICIITYMYYLRIAKLKLCQAITVLIKLYHMQVMHNQMTYFHQVHRSLWLGQ